MGDRNPQLGNSADAEPVRRFSQEEQHRADVELSMVRDEIAGTRTRIAFGKFKALEGFSGSKEEFFRQVAECFEPCRATVVTSDKIKQTKRVEEPILLRAIIKARIGGKQLWIGAKLIGLQQVPVAKTYVELFCSTKKEGDISSEYRDAPAYRLFLLENEPTPEWITELTSPTGKKPKPKRGKQRKA